MKLWSNEEADMVYLLDTNAFFEVICGIADIKTTGMVGFSSIVWDNKCYVSKITLIEIISVIGKYGRGEPREWQICHRVTETEDKVCGRRFLNPGRKRWKNRVVRDMIKLVREVTAGGSDLWQVEVLPVTEAVLHEAEHFIYHSVNYKFASMDAVIASTARVYEREHGERITVLTADKSLRRALQIENMEIWPKG